MYALELTDTVLCLAWVGWLDLSIVIGTLALALLNASKDSVARNFAYVYALISVGVLVCSFLAGVMQFNLIFPRSTDTLCTNTASP